MLSRLCIRRPRVIICCSNSRYSTLAIRAPDSNTWHSSRKTANAGARPYFRTSGRFQSFSTASDKSVEEQYGRLTPLEHVLRRPGMYVGPTARAPPSAQWILHPSPPPPPSHQLLMDPNLVQHSSSILNYRLTKQEVAIVPALIKVFDEILVNASDNRLRSNTTTRIDVLIDPGSEERDPFIRVFNDGMGIPVHVHQQEGIYVPELLFGHLLTGSNFDDSERKVTGGRHGYGAKLTNIFSKSFTIETVDSSRHLKYRQTWSNNMTSASVADVTTDTSGRDYTCVSFVPDLPQLTGNGNALCISKDDYAVMCRRVLDVAACAAGQLTVTLNGVDLTQSTFRDYVMLHRTNPDLDVCFETLNDRWVVAVGVSETGGNFESVSFVNGMTTTRGGLHVNAIVQQVCKRIQERIDRTEPELTGLVSPGLIRRHLFVAVDALIENPSFDSQMKEYLTSSPNAFGSSCTLSDKFLSRVVLSEEEGGPGIVEEVVRVARGRQQANLLKSVGGKKSRRQIMSIPKLDDAHSAGSENGHRCTLILTEGDSAKALAVAGLEVVGRERYGVFPLRGKFLNVRHATVAQLASNAEVKALCSILGLDFDKEYDTEEERRELRYGRVMLMTDQDTDGSHIKGLVINFFRHFWPKLLMPPVDRPPSETADESTFLLSFVTPLLKVSKKGKKEVLAFYSIPEYQSWRNSIPDDEMKKWNVKYYKGLGTSTPAEAKDYFSAFDKHVRPFQWHCEADGELLDLVFDKSRAAERKQWILDEFDPESRIEIEGEQGNNVSYQDFLNKEMIHFSWADNVRSLPSVVDGLKPSQRKVLFACFKRKLKSEIKVAQLTGYCAEHTAYHHGEASLHSTIVGMAQDFVGSNNINLLVPSGQFGTRLQGGDDAASPRYIFTQLSPIARYIFPEVDDNLLSHREDDGQSIEPEFFCPIIPLLLVNGSMGIGTGWSCFVPAHHPMDVLDYVLARLNESETLPEIRPFARGFTGQIDTKPGGGGYVSSGRLKVLSSKSILIDELPLGCWTDKYKKVLLKMRDRGELVDFVENHTTSRVSFTVTMKIAQLERMQRSGLEKTFRLFSSLPTTNMHAFDANNQIQKFASAQAIADSFIPVRMSLYQDRKSVLESEMKYTTETIRNKARFIEAVTAGRLELVSGRKSKAETVSALHELGFTPSSQLKEIRNDNTLHSRQKVDDEDVAAESMVSPGSEFDYLLNLPLSSLTSERITDLRDEASRKENELNGIQSSSAVDLWRTDLEKLAPVLEKEIG